MAGQVTSNYGGMVGLPGRQGWGLVEDPGHEQIRTFGEVGGIAEFGDAADRKAGPGDATTLISGGGNVSALPPTTAGTTKPTLAEFLNKLTLTPADGLVKNRDSLFNEYQGLLADIKDPLLRSILAKLFLALLSDPPDMAALMQTAQKLDTYVKTQDFLSGKTNQVPPEVMRLLESKYGNWKGIGKNVDPTKGTGPNGGRLLRDTIRNMLECKDEEAQKSYSAAQKTASPLVFDLNGDGKVGTTGVGKVYDLDGDGTLDKTAWAGSGDGVLAFDRNGDGVAGADGTEIFGNNTIVDGRKFDNGFEALKALAAKHLGPEAVADGKLGAAELKALSDKTGLCMLVDGKKVSLGDLGITEISVGYSEAGQNLDEHGNEHRQVGKGFVRNGQQAAVDDVWFRYEAGAGQAS